MYLQVDVFKYLGERYNSRAAVYVIREKLDPELQEAAMYILHRDVTSLFQRIWPK